MSNALASVDLRKRRRGTSHHPGSKPHKENVAVEMGWGRLLFAHTFADPDALAEALLEERPGKRDIALYIQVPHVILAKAPADLFLDPSHTFRLWLGRYRPSAVRPRGFIVRRIQRESDTDAINRIYQQRGMVPADPAVIWGRRRSRTLTHLVAEDTGSGEIIGSVMGVDHTFAWNDPENGSSLWCLAVDSGTCHPGVGETLVRHLTEHYQARGRSHMDLSVLHDNTQAIALYEKLGFERVPAFCIKRKNPINERLFVLETEETAGLNPYARIIIDEARRRGIGVEVLDKPLGLFRLSFGGRSVVCRESLTEMTSAVALQCCADKQVTSRLLAAAGLAVPEQVVAGVDDAGFLAKHGRIVVKPCDGEQGAGISVDVRTADDLARAVARAAEVKTPVLLERFVEGEDLRIVVINYKVAAAAVRRPPHVVGNGRDSVRALITKLDRRRAAATQGESRIPMDDETARCVGLAGFSMSSVLPQGVTIPVRRTANLHTGGTIHDVTERLSPRLAAAAEEAARVLRIPVVGFDFLVPSVEGDEYVVIEANERPGLANHEPQPLVQRFVDLLFPHTCIAGWPASGEV